VITPPVAVVSGMVAGEPGQAGASWAVLQYVLGLRSLGFDVVLVEPVKAPAGGRPLAATASARWLDAVSARLDLARRACLVSPAGETYGMDGRDMRELAARAELLLNVSGMLPLEPPFDDIPVRAYLDLDPAFNQLWHQACGIDMGFAGHTCHVTVGLNVGTDGCSVPTCGLEWIHSLPPVDLGEWPVSDRLVHDAMTTLGNWRSYGCIEHEGVFLGQKAHSMRALLALAARSPKFLHPAFAIDPSEPDAASMAAAGWSFLDPAPANASLDAYRDFVAGSWAELGVAKSGYVASRSGWFSDRSACYLASGRPVLAQDTGVGPHLPVGEGLVTFSGVDDGVAAIEDLVVHYRRHRRAARELAEAYFDARGVLARLVVAMGAR
jgi:hypothetical protein